MKMRGKSDRCICPRCPPFENREGWGSLCRGGTDKQTSSVYMSAVPTLRKPRRVGQPLSWRYRQANVISVYVRGAHPSKTAKGGAASVVAVPTSKRHQCICPRCPPFENREGWGSLCRGGTDKQTSSVYMSAVPTLRKPRRVGQPLSWRYRQANVISVYVRGAHPSKTAKGGAAFVVAVPTSKRHQ